MTGCKRRIITRTDTNDHHSYLINLQVTAAFTRLTAAALFHAVDTAAAKKPSHAEKNETKKNIQLISLRRHPTQIAFD